ncbi:hypothetical protein GIB67_007278 [Kingdonia uniflora]|uniref:DUF155 domain-containing protein n=1 Tax=Kingdonia uniflora TaxID=39325 RepID=A0A7J7NX24_9MAGN|nr:hypothetical protein GIB67_007278 [Kingdonia uniflora]
MMRWRASYLLIKNITTRFKPHSHSNPLLKPPNIFSSPFRVLPSWGSRYFSANPSPWVYDNDFYGGNHEFGQNYVLESKEEEEEVEEDEKGKIPVKAYFLSTSVKNLTMICNSDNSCSSGSCSRFALKLKNNKKWLEDTIRSSTVVATVFDHVILETKIMHVILEMKIMHVILETKIIHVHSPSTKTIICGQNLPPNFEYRDTEFVDEEHSSLKRDCREYEYDSNDNRVHTSSPQWPLNDESKDAKDTLGFGSIDLKSMQAENSSNLVPPTSRSSNYIALKYCNFSPEITHIGIQENTSGCRYMVVFQYGSAVLFNIEDHEVESYLEIVRRHASGLLPEMRKDDYAVKVKQLMMEDMQGGPDYIVLKKLDLDGIRIIGSVLGQSMALDYFVSQVDGMVEEFTDINRDMVKTGTFTMKRKKLFQLVGKANSNMADVILKVGLFDRSEIAWKDAKYAQILDYLRDEYEVAQRFGNLDFKLKFVEHNIHFLQVALQNRRSDLLEWCIIILLSIQNVVSVYEIIQDSTATPL